jgi:archaemetzincin
MRSIELVPLAAGVQLSLPVLAADLADVLKLPVHVTGLRIDMEQAYDSSRRQYHSTRVLSLLVDHAPPGDSRLLGVTALDLFVPVLTYVFGQAQLGSRAGVFSFHRLRNEQYGLPASGELLQDRALKEALHELGHTFGLRHCFDTPCAMNTSTYVEDIDLKPAHYCTTCAHRVRLAIEQTATDASPGG